MELRRDKKKDLHMVFMDLEKIYDRIPCQMVWESLEKKEVLAAYIRAIKDMCKEVRTNGRTLGRDT